MAGVAQLAERQVVVLDAVGSNPIARPSLFPRWQASARSQRCRYRAGRDRLAGFGGLRIFASELIVLE